MREYSLGQEFDTEKGKIAVSIEFSDEDIAIINGYSYSFTVLPFGRVYSKLSDVGHRRFAVITSKEETDVKSGAFTVNTVSSNDSSFFDLFSLGIISQTDVSKRWNYAWFYFSILS